jgi:hypothetical protein
MCHAPASLTQSALAAGGDWQCIRCGQHWDAARLAAVAAYAAWVVQLEQPGLRHRTAKASNTHEPQTAPRRDRRSTPR